jgi:hypothetical protein
MLCVGNVEVLKCQLLVASDFSKALILLLLDQELLDQKNNKWFLALLINSAASFTFSI